MREENIEKMDFKELRKEVQLLRDELAIFKRKWEDMAYNLDNENFSSSIVKEKDGMKAEIKVTAEEIKTKVSKTDLENELESYSTISQTAEAIQTVVSKGANLDEAEVIESLDKATDTSKIYVIQEINSSGELVSETYYYYNEIMKSWEVLSGDSIYTVFKQTDDGFEMKGNVVIDGNAVVTKNLVLSGNVTWDMENSPVKTQYSSDMVAWHTDMTDSDLYMRMSFDGGGTWSSPTKVVGTDGKNGKDGDDGSDANVTPQNVFNALTDDGATQGLFSVFYNEDDRLFINAEYIRAGTLSGMKFTNTAGTVSLKLGGEVSTSMGDLTLQAQDRMVFQVYDNATITLFKVNETQFLTSSGINTYAKGNWDFSGCTNLKLPDSVGGDGVAKFG